MKRALQDQESIFYYYKKLIELRKNHEIIVYGTYDLILEEHPSIFAYVRTWKDETLLVIANFTEDECVFEMPGEGHLVVVEQPHRLPADSGAIDGGAVAAAEIDDIDIA